MKFEKEFRFDITIRRAIVATGIGFYFGVLFHLMGWM